MPTFNPAPITALGDKIVADINAAKWIPAQPANADPLEFFAKRVYFLPDYEPTDLGLYVDLLVGEEPDEDLADRGNTYDRTFMVAIGIQKTLADKTDVTEIDGLAAFVESLRTFYPVQGEFNVNVSQLARCVKREKPVLYSPEELDKNGRFFSVVHLTFEGWYTP